MTKTRERVFVTDLLLYINYLPKFKVHVRKEQKNLETRVGLGGSEEE